MSHPDGGQCGRWECLAGESSRRVNRYHLARPGEEEKEDRRRVTDFTRRFVPDRMVTWLKIYFPLISMA